MTTEALTNLLHVQHPIIQGPFGGLRSQRLTAAVSNFGALGSLGANALEPTRISEAIAELRALTERPFAVNLWVSTEDEAAARSERAAFDASVAALAPRFRELGAALPTYKRYPSMNFAAQARAVLDAKVPVFSFIVGVPPAEILQECRERGIVSIGTATTPAEAVALERAGVDAIVASGFEAGGHRGSFLARAEESLVGTFALVPQVCDVVSVPVIAAGGIADARGVVAAFALGASGAQIGTALLACDGSGATRAHRDALSRQSFTPTALSHGLTGRLARGLNNRLMQTVNQPGVDVLPYPLQRGLVRELTQVAEAAGQSELTLMWSGQSAGLTRTQDATAFLTKLVSDVARIAPAIAAWSAT
jgi:nitronate monooxygenase